MNTPPPTSTHGTEPEPCGSHGNPLGAALPARDLTRIMGEAAARRFEEELARRPMSGAAQGEGAHTPARTPASPQVSGGPLDAWTSASVVGPAEEGETP